MGPLLTTTENQVLKISLNRAEQSNALNNELRDSLEQALATAEIDENITAVVLTTSSKTFSIGYDLKEVIDTELKSFAHRALEYNKQLYGFKKPLVVAARGFCLAGGFDLALAGDYILATKKTMFGHPEIKFGAPPFVLPLARKVGLDLAKRLIFKGEMVSSKKALELGIIDNIYEDDQLEARAIKLAKQIGKWDKRTSRILKEVSTHFENLDQAIEDELGLAASFIEDPEVLGQLKDYVKTLAPGLYQ